MKKKRDSMSVNEYKQLQTAKKPKRNVQIEDAEKKLFIKRMRKELPECEKLLLPLDLHAIKLSIGQAVKLKALGAKKGVSDYFLAIPKRECVQKYNNGDLYIVVNHGLFIEFKRDKYDNKPKGRQSKDQKIFEKLVLGSGYKYIILYSADEAMKEVKQYLGFN